MMVDGFQCSRRSWKWLLHDNQSKLWTNFLRSERWRRAAVMNFMADGTRFVIKLLSPCKIFSRFVIKFLSPCKIFSQLYGICLCLVSSLVCMCFAIVLLTRSAFGGPLLQGVPSVGMGERIEGQCFPLVFQPNKITFNSFQNPNFWSGNKLIYLNINKADFLIPEIADSLFVLPHKQEHLMFSNHMTAWNVPS